MTHRDISENNWKDEDWNFNLFIYIICNSLHVMSLSPWIKGKCSFNMCVCARISLWTTVVWHKVKHCDEITFFFLSLSPRCWNDSSFQIKTDDRNTEVYSSFWWVRSASRRSSSKQRDSPSLSCSFSCSGRLDALLSHQEVPINPCPQPVHCRLLSQQ